ncbi:MAG: carbohydrate-binding domain-containing protein [bacterium]|nr:carbohydrate-binding domain-containing protein [bacterium]
MSGTLGVGRIVVDADSDENVRLILNGADIANSTTSPFVVDNASEVMVVLAEGTTNTLSDTAGYVFADAETDEPDAALFSTADLTIAGTGTLVVDGNFNDGIASKDGLVIAGGTIDIDAADDAVHSNDTITITGGDSTLASADDALHADANIVIDAGTITVTDSYEGIESAIITINDGDIDITSSDDGLMRPLAMPPAPRWGVLEPNRPARASTSCTSTEAPSASTPRVTGSTPTGWR